MRSTVTTTRRGRRSGRVGIAILGLALLVLAVASVAVASSPSPAADGETFRVGWVAGPDNMNPFLGLVSQDYEIYHLNYDVLCGWDAKNFKPRPEIAESWTVSPDGKTWTFKIRQGVKFQDGTPLTARDVAFSYNYVMDLGPNPWELYVNHIKKVTAADDATVIIETDRPKANMLATFVAILPEHIWKNVSPKEATESFKNPVPLIGSGPFQVVEWQKGKFTRLEANKDYWGGAPKIDELLFIEYKNVDTMQADLNSGTIDAAVGLPLAQIDTLEKDPALTIVRGTPWGFKNLAFNCYDSPASQGNPVLRDAAFRRALNWAIDREKIAGVAFFGEAQPGSSLLPPYSSAHYAVPQDQLYTYDPEKAKTELDAAGYKDVNGDGVRETKDGRPLDLRFYVATDSSENQTAAKMMAGWFKDVGVKVTMEMMDTSALLDAIYTYKGDTYAPDFDMFVWQWTYDPDPTSPLAILCTWNIEGWSDTLWSNAEYDKLFDQQDQELDPDTRDQIGQAMQKIAYEESPYIIFVYHTQMEAYRSDKWQGVVASPSDIQGFDGAAFYNYMNIDTYRFVTPKLGATESSGANTSAMAGVGVVAGLAVLGIVLLVVKRRRSRTVEE